MTDAHAAHEEQAVHRRLMRFGEAESLATPMWVERDTSVRAVAAHLASLWDTPAPIDDEGTPTVTEKGLPHARASVLNLVVSVLDDPAADRVVQTLLDLGVRHPSRAVVLVPEPRTADSPLDARISTHCHDAIGSGERICYEEVVLTVRGEAAAHLNGIVAPLLIHDLPTHVWWPGDPPFNDPVFDQLVEMGDRLIVDRRGKNVIRVSAAGKFLANFAAVNAERLVRNELDDVAMIDRDTKGIVIVDRDGKPLSRIPAKGTNYQFEDLADLAFDPLGHLYVLDSRKAAIHVFGPKNRLLATISSAGKEQGALQKPRAIAVDAAGRLYVFDESSQRIQVYQ